MAGGGAGGTTVTRTPCSCPARRMDPEMGLRARGARDLIPGARVLGGRKEEWRRGSFVETGIGKSGRRGDHDEVSLDRSAGGKVGDDFPSGGGKEVALTLP